MAERRHRSIVITWELGISSTAQADHNQVLWQLMRVG